MGCRIWFVVCLRDGRRMRTGSAKAGNSQGARKSPPGKGQRTTTQSPASAGGASLDRERRSVTEEATLEHGFCEREGSWRSVIENEKRRRGFREVRCERLSKRETLKLKL